MKYEVYDDIYQFYKENYGKIESKEIYKWKAVKHFQDNWSIEAVNFPEMLENALKKVGNLMDSGSYYPHRMILWAANKEPETVRKIFRELYDLDIDIKDRIATFKEEISGIIERNQEGKVSKSYQDDRAIMVYLNLRYPEKYFLYKYGMLYDFNQLVDYTELPPAGSIELLFVFENLCEMILKRVLEDKELLEKLL